MTRIPLDIHNKTESRRSRIRDQEGGGSLPDEVWVAIFENVVDPNRPFQAHRYLLPLTLVSQRWARLLLYTPTLWTNIKIENGTEDLEATVQVLLSLSGDCRLSLSWAFGSHCTRQVVHLLYPHIHRVASLNLLASISTDQLQTVQTDALVPKIIFPQLQALEYYKIPTHVMVEFMSNHKPFSHCAEMVDEWNYTTLLRSDGIHLTKVEIRSVYDPTLRLLQENKSLRAVTIFHGPVKQARWDFNAKDSSLGWTTLHCFHFPWMVTENLVRGCVTTLVALRVTIDWRDTPDFLAILFRIGTLQFLMVAFTGGQFEEERHYEPPPLPTSQSNLRELEIQFSALITRTVDTRLLIHPLLHHSIKLSSYKIWGPCNRVLECSDVSHFPSLRSFTLQQSEARHAEVSGEHVLRSQSLEEVEVDACTDTLNLLSSDTTLRLIFNLVNSRRPPALTTIQVLGERWPVLEALSIKTPPTRPWMESKLVISARTLKRLCLEGRPVVTAMVGYMAQHPDAFPILQSLELGSSPEWDVLFIMLEKRLSTGVRPLEKLVFFRAIQPSLKAALVRLFTGRVVMRPSNYELSMQGNLAAYLDVTILGCVECHLYLHDCRHPLSRRDDPLPIREEHPYPGSVDEILATRQERYNIYKLLYDHWDPFLGFRTNDCQLRVELVEISRHSIIL